MSVIVVRPASVRAAITIIACAVFALSFLLHSLPSQYHRRHSPAASDLATIGRNSHQYHHQQHMNPNSAVPFADISSATANQDPAMAAVNQFSIWAMPPAGSRYGTRASEAIQLLAAELATPPFEPHVTVVGAFGLQQGLSEEEVVKRTAALTDRVAPYRVSLEEMSSGALYFQCVFLKMKKTPEVLEANRKARAIMSIDSADAEETKPVYMPHLSLVYGNLTEEQKESAKETVRAKFQDLLEEDAGYLVDSWALYRTEPNDLMMTTWEKIGEFPLKGK